MTQMIDTEGAEIPKDEDGRTYFDVDMCDWNDEKGPELSINIPCFFEDGNGAQYDGYGKCYGDRSNLCNNLAVHSTWV